MTLQEAGCFAVVMECVPAPVAAAATSALQIPTIGVGAGPFCNGQVLVYHDLLGMMQHPHHAKCKKRVCDISYDEISELLEEILESILSRLSLKEATKTSVLSSRWRYLWTYFNGDMCFSDSGIDWAEFVQRINGILKLHRASTVTYFRIVFLKIYSVEDIYPWIEFVASKDVKLFQLILGHQLNHTTRNLVMKDVKRFQLRLGPYSAMPYSSFGSLKILYLSYVAVSHAFQ